MCEEPEIYGSGCEAGKVRVEMERSEELQPGCEQGYGKAGSDCQRH